MNEAAIIPDGWIVDKDIAEEVAYSAKLQRSTAAASRAVDLAIKEAGGIEQSDDPDKQLETGLAILGIYSAYPEVFVKLFKPSQSERRLNFKEKTEAISEIFKHGKLPIWKVLGDGEEPSAERLDKKADITETATEALLVHPPSQDFLRYFRLGNEFYLGTRWKGYERRVTVKEITNLSSYAESLEGHLKFVERDFADWLEYYEGESGDNDKLQKSLFLCKKVASYWPADDKEGREQFEAQVQTARNSEETRIGDFKQLSIDGKEQAVQSIQEVIETKWRIFHDVISGAAANYSSPDLSPVVSNT